jgi:hypothetical protein
MPTQVQFRRGTTAQNNNFFGAEGELSIDLTKKTLRVHDGVTQGGFALVTNLDLTTANVAEVTNLYFTNVRADARVSPAFNVANVALTNASAAFDSANTKTIAADLTTANVIEITNLYYTDARVYAAVTGNLALKANVADFTTANVAELTNLYFTNVRADARVSPAFNVANAAVSLAETVFNSSNTKTVAADLTTANVTEVTNLYFTNARAVAALTGQTVSMGEATITGNLFVLGNVVEFNTETLTVEDKNVVLANGSPSAAASDGAGITIDGADATLLYVNTGDKWEFNKDLSVVGGIAATGNITSPFFYSESDIALKEDVNPISNALKKVLKLTGVDFIWKKTNQKGLGVIAQEVEKIIPHIVSTSNAGYKTVQYDSLVPLLIEAIKDQQKQINELRKKIK